MTKLVSPPIPIVREAGGEAGARTDLHKPRSLSHSPVLIRH